MSFRRFYHPSYNFTYAQCEGIVDDYDLYIHILTSQMELKEWKLIRGLLDCRYIHKVNKLTAQGLIRACEIQVDEYADRDYLFAIIVSDYERNLTIAKMYAHTLRSGNLKVGVFVGDIEEALVWLGYDRRTKEYLKGKIAEHTKIISDDSERM